MATTFIRRWRRCDHIRTPENTCEVTAHSPGGRCRTCKNDWLQRQFVENTPYAQRKRAHAAAWKVGR